MTWPTCPTCTKQYIPIPTLKDCPWCTGDAYRPDPNEGWRERYNRRRREARALQRLGLP